MANNRCPEECRWQLTPYNQHENQQPSISGNGHHNVTRSRPSAGLRDLPAGAAPHPAQMTSHENALGTGQDERNIVHNEELSQEDLKQPFLDYGTTSTAPAPRHGESG